MAKENNLKNKIDNLTTWTLLGFILILILMFMINDPQDIKLKNIEDSLPKEVCYIEEVITEFKPTEYEMWRTFPEDADIMCQEGMFVGKEYYKDDYITVGLTEPTTFNLDKRLIEANNNLGKICLIRTKLNVCEIR